METSSVTLSDLAKKPEDNTVNGKIEQVSRLNDCYKPLPD